MAPGTKPIHGLSISKPKSLHPQAPFSSAPDRGTIELKMYSPMKAKTKLPSDAMKPQPITLKNVSIAAFVVNR
jgi:hypothetical protein